MEIFERYLAVLALLICFVVWHFVQRSSNPPPSPPRDPILGHALKLPQSEAWKKFAEWGKLYGPVVFAEALGRPMIVVNTITAARDLMEKRSTNYSDRPKMVVLELVGWETILLLQQYKSPRFRDQRRLTRLHLGASALQSYEGIIEEQVKKFLRQLLATPTDFYRHAHGHVANMVVKIVYGHEVSGNPLDDPRVHMIEQAQSMIKATGNFGATILDFFPFLRYVPSWIPGMDVKRKALEARRTVDMAFSQPFEEVKIRKAAGNPLRCVVSALLDDREASRLLSFKDEDELKSFAGAFYTGATETTTATLQAFFLMMALHPDVQRRAQEDIDRTIGRDRLPLLSDRASLPYIDCIIKEVLRVQPPFPLGVPHRTNQEDKYRSWTIPGKAVVIPNICCVCVQRNKMQWHTEHVFICRYMMKDEELFPEPEKFDPDRHATCGERKQTEGGGVEDPVSSVFGFGRRICPGRAFAEAVMWITVASALATFDILPFKDPNDGKDVLPIVEYYSEIVNSVKPFKCSIVPSNKVIICRAYENSSNQKFGGQLTTTRSQD